MLEPEYDIILEVVQMFEILVFFLHQPIHEQDIPQLSVQTLQIMYVILQNRIDIYVDFMREMYVVC